MSTTNTTTGCADPQTLPDDPRLLKDMIVELLATLRQRTSELEGVRQRLDQLLRRLYGPRGERWDPNQPLLFPEIMQALSGDVAAVSEPAAEPVTEPANGPVVKRPGHGRRQLPKHLPRRQQVLDVPDTEKGCPCCGGQRRQIGEAKGERPDYQPANLFIR